MMSDEMPSASAMASTLRRLWRQKVEELEFAVAARARFRSMREGKGPFAFDESELLRKRSEADAAVRLIEGECLALAKACDLLERM
jgi:hypothetical protein